MKFDRLNSKHSILILPSPNDADLAIVSINSGGNLGQLNEFVLSQYGYSLEDLPSKEQLEYAGFGAITNSKGKPILFVVTIDGKRKTLEALEVNLYNTLKEFRGWLINKKVWLPLMGTGSGGLTLEESFNTTIKVVNKFQNDFPIEVFFIISLPNSDEAQTLYNNLNENRSLEEHSVDKLVEKLNCTFYLANTYLRGQDKIEKFLKEGIWEKDYANDSYSSIVNRIKQNDVIIIKSTSNGGTKGNVGVKGIGIVTEASLNGISLPVDWRIREISLNITIGRKYREPIDTMDLVDVKTIFSFLDSNEWRKLLPPSTSHPLIKNKIAGLLSDTEKGADYLSITKDVTAFARVIAARSFEPPLAIALFGKWGSGKSFFMRKVKEQIIEFSERNANNMYCEGVVHIHFNAWSYMDANLWASFVSKIFEGLNEYITENSLSAQAKKEIEAELSSSLIITKEELTILEGKRDAVQIQIVLLEEKRITIKQEVEDKIEQIEKHTIWSTIRNVDKEFNAKEKIIDELRQNKTFLETEEEIKKIIPDKYWENPEEAYRQIVSKYTFLKEFFRRDNIKTNLIWLSFFLTLIFLTPLLLRFLSVRISQFNFLIPQAGLSFLIMVGACWRRAEVVYKKLQPVMASFWKIKEKYEKEKGEAIAKFEQQEKILKFEIEKGKEELLSLTDQLEKAENIKTDLEFKISNAIATEALYSFIEKRSKSDDYKKHLGIISIIRRDFEILNGLFTDHHQDIVDTQKAETFRKKFKRPLQRIVLYVDDLDRCPEENVVQVLEAVNLLMAFPLFVVIVGVDPRWVKNALIKKYALQFTGKLNGSNQIESGIGLIEPSNYLEKIFQVPFHLKDASVNSVKEMIRKLATSRPAVISSLKQIKDDITSNNFDNIDQEGNASRNLNIVNTSETISVNDKLSVSVDESIELLELSESEVDLMQDMSELIGPNPRALKRFVNIYRIIKAHEDYTVGYEPSKKDLCPLLFLLALASGKYKELVTSFEKFIEDKKNINKPVKLYFQSELKIENLQNTKQQLTNILSHNSSYQLIQESEVNVFVSHNKFIKRFTFNHI